MFIWSCTIYRFYKTYTHTCPYANLQTTGQQKLE